MVCEYTYTLIAHSPVINTDAGRTPASNTPKKQRATARLAKLLVKAIKHTTIPQPKPIELIHHRGLILCSAKLQGISATTYCKKQKSEFADQIFSGVFVCVVCSVTYT